MSAPATGAQAIFNAFLKERVDIVFGHADAAIAPVLALFGGTNIRWIGAASELGAAHMADGYARVTGRPGVVLVGSGAAAMALLPAIGSAQLDSVPLVIVTGQVPSYALGYDVFAEGDTVGITRPVVKHSYLVRDAAELPRIMKEAFYVAATGRPGPVLVDVPVDLQAEVLKSAAYPDAPPVMRNYRPVTTGHPRQVQKAARAIEKAERPLFYCGAGANVSDSAQELLAHAERCDIPVATTVLGLGSFPEDHRLSLGLLGTGGAADKALAECDCLIAVGARFDGQIVGNLDAFAPKCRNAIIQIDIDPSSVSKVLNIPFPIVGDVKEVLGMMLSEVKGRKLAPWNSEVSAWRKEEEKASASGALKALRAAVEQIQKAQPRAIFAVDHGDLLAPLARAVVSRAKRSWLTAAGLGTQGFSLPAALGACAAQPAATVVCVSTEASLRRAFAELRTAVDARLTVKVILVSSSPVLPAIVAAAGWKVFRQEEPKALSAFVSEVGPALLALPAE